MTETPSDSHIIIYNTEGGRTRIEVRLLDETVWLTQAQMSELFDKDKRTISEHIQNIFKEGELSPDSTIRKFRTVQIEGSREVARQIDFYNLDAIISVGYRVSSHRGTQFRISVGPGFNPYMPHLLTSIIGLIQRHVLIKLDRLNESKQGI